MWTNDAAIVVSTRELVDTATRSLRAHGVSYPVARYAADVVEELHAVDGSGAAILLEALRRPITAATVHGRTVHAMGCSALLVAATIEDLLIATGEATVVDVAAPYAVLGALRRVAAARGGGWTANWSHQNSELRGGCHLRPDGHADLLGDPASGDPRLPTVTLHATHDRRRPRPAASSTRLPTVTDALRRARESGIAVARDQWLPLAHAAQDFLVDTTTQ